MDTIIDAIREAQDDSSLPRAARQKLDEIVEILQGPGDVRLKVSKALAELEELSENSSVPSYVRPQLWNIASQLERVVL
jgi:uncharacterized protein (UPF0147 family)